MPTISADQVAAHEVALEPNAEVVVEVVLGASPTNDIEVLVLAATSPVYVRSGAATVTPKDAGARMVPPGGSLVVNVDYGVTGLGRVRLVSAARATVAVGRT